MRGTIAYWLLVLAVVATIAGLMWLDGVQQELCVNAGGTYVRPGNCAGLPG
jgi:hypothetical protein